MADRIDEIRALLAAATPGPYAYDDGITDDTTGERGKPPAVYAHGAVWVCSPEAEDPAQADADGRFLAAAPSNIRYLLLAVEALRQTLAATERDAQQAEAAYAERLGAEDTAEARGAERERATRGPHRDDPAHGPAQPIGATATGWAEESEAGGLRRD